MTTQQQPRKALLLSLIPGLGQIYNKQKAKGAIFLGVTILFLIYFFAIAAPELGNLITLGEVPGRDNSLFMLIRGAFHFILVIVYFIFYALNLKDAYTIAKRWNNDYPVPTTFKDMLKGIYANGFPYLLIIPSYIAMTFAIIFPVLVTLLIAFTNYDFQHLPPTKLLDWVGVTNFTNIWRLSTFRSAFGAVLGWTIIWALTASTVQIVIGIFTAIIANQPFIKGKRIFGVIFLLPWAVPAFITILTFSNMFNDSIGAINTQVIPLLGKVLPFLNGHLIPWKTDPTWTKVALIMMQGWLGFPYIYVLTLGILQSIPNDLYEAAYIDGANAWQKFRNITFPMILAVAAPTLISQYTFNFNNFSIMYLFNDGGPGTVGGGAGSTDILISWIYRLTTGAAPQYSMAAAVTLIISLIVISISMIAFKKLHAFDMEDV
ncbi:MULTISPECIES: sugar ABC transporter permease [Streptococcus]|uniref:Maltose/maltodextrin transport system permease protein n=2 Tax=Streptococcus anginosus group TaxID=671232 RepID=T1ZGS6_STRIT|nr:MULTISPECIES: sugar ABC transporter permease [Streptococcus]RKV94131.1 MAG: sugar ABC transporter permease [Streptococcus sp.]AGU77153.1 maltose/maltodextrin transport system permease protein [Streptococcus intermedius B196]EHG11243.1 maltodextrin transport system permease malC [Streptococcus intermedius F0413]EID82970.1 TM2 domain / ABC transporter, permease multi-domain protein [Streptococcus intermedius SK54 = ATCC 27335]EJP26524.1 ABC transporter, permease protein [Streptococcus anginos